MLAAAALRSTWPGLVHEHDARLDRRNVRAGSSHEMKRLLVTGATGFLGRHVSKLLGAGGFEVHTASRTKDGGREFGTVEHVTDLLAAGAPTALVQSIQPSHLLHLAWSTPRSQSWMGIENLAWVSASLELFRAFVETGGKRAVFAGSCAEYDWAYENLHEIETPARSWTLYGTAKNAVRDLVEMTGRQSGVSTAWARILFSVWALRTARAAGFRCGLCAPGRSPRENNPWPTTTRLHPRCRRRQGAGGLDRWRSHRHRERRVRRMRARSKSCRDTRAIGAPSRSVGDRGAGFAGPGAVASRCRRQPAPQGTGLFSAFSARGGAYGNVGLVASSDGTRVTLLPLISTIAVASTADRMREHGIGAS